MTRNKVTGSTRALGLISLMAAIALLIGMLPVCAVATENTWAASVGDTQYATVAEAVEHANGSYVKLLADSQESITVSADLYLDLNGHTLAAVTVSSGTLHGMDSTTDDYDCEDGYGKILSVTGGYARQHKSDVTGSIRRYLAVEEDGAVSFHRLYLGITQSSIAPASYGVGYKAVFAGDAKVAAQLHETDAFGYRLQLAGGGVVERWKAASAFVKEQTVTLRVKNYDADNFGEAQLSAAVQVQLADGTVITSEEHCNSLRGMVEAVNAATQNYSRAKLNALAAWINGSSVMQTWQVENILSGIKHEELGEGGFTEW